MRFLFLIGTAASVPMAASATAAFGDGGAAFAIPWLLLTLAAGSMDGLVFLVLVDLLLLAVIVAEHVRIEGVGSATSDDPVDNVASA